MCGRRTRSMALALGVVGALACSSGSDSPTAPAGQTIPEIENLSFQLINTARTSNSVDPQLTWSAAAAALARAHSERMRDEGFFGHVGPDGRDLSDRLAAGGLTVRAAGENLAQINGANDPAAFAHGQLMASTEHRDQILAARYRAVGVGVARSGDTYWFTQIFLQP